jgi:hypothetical protein
MMGDFNMSSRTHSLIEGEHISLFKEILPGARFAPPNPPYYTHCNTYKNVGSATKQLDAFDHFVVINPSVL